MKLNDQGSVNFTPSGVDFANPNSFYMRGLIENRSRSMGDQWQWQGYVVLDTDSSLFPKFSSVCATAIAAPVRSMATVMLAGQPEGTRSTRCRPSRRGGIIGRASGATMCSSSAAGTAQRLLFNDRLNDVRDYIRQALVRAGADAGTQSGVGARDCQISTAQCLQGARAGL